jgi:hypothetical protein
MRTARVKLQAITIAVLLLSACAGNRAPTQIAGDVAHNGTIVVNSVDTLQKFVASQEAAGRIPRNTAATAMEAIGRSLKAAQTAGQYLDKLVKLPSGNASDPIIQQIQDALTVASSEAALALVPIGDESTRMQIARLIGEINKAIGQVNGFILSRRQG